MDYARLASDLKAAREAAERAVEHNPEDGGAPNRDATMIYLPGGWTGRVKHAGEAAGLHLTRLSDEGSWRISAPRGGNGNMNTRQAVIMRDVLRASGWDVDVQYRMA